MIHLPAGRFLALGLVLLLLQAANGQTTKFRKQVLTDKYYCDGVVAGRINRDAHIDIVAGPFWYEGPDFRTAHAFYAPKVIPTEPSPSNSMFSFIRDLNNDGRNDIIVLGRVHKHEAKWYQNPGSASTEKSAAAADQTNWDSHTIFERVRGESPTLTSISAESDSQLLCHWDGRWGWIQPDANNATAPWAFRAVGENLDWPQFYHGQGVGDINGDGRRDIVVNDGWYEQPSVSTIPKWTFHRHRFSQARGGAQMFVYDVDGDGDGDVISSIDAHGWGLAWYEHQRVGDSIRFREHKIMGNREEAARFGAAFSQPHALALADIDGDGLLDIVTGKRRWAHGPKGDIEPNAEPVVYWFQLKRLADGQVRYQPHQIDNASGVGVQIDIADVNQDGRPDVLTASKLGVFVFYNEE